MTLFFITFERYLSVLHPVVHRSYVTNNRMLICAICAPICCAVTSPVSAIISQKLCDVISVVITLLSSRLTHLPIQKYTLPLKICTFQNDGIGDYSTEQSSSNMEWKRKSLRERTLAKSCALVVFISYFCYVPFAVCYLCFKNDLINLRFAGYSSGVILILNLSLNSVIFFWRRPLLRGEALNVVRKILRK